MSKVSHSVSSSHAMYSFHLKTSIVVACFGISISNFPPAAAWDDGSVFQIKRAKAPVNVLLVSKVTQLVIGIAICQVDKGVFVEKGFLQGVTGQHQLQKPMGGCDARPFFPSAAELLMVLLCWLAVATAAPLLAAWGRGPLSERSPQLVFFIIKVLVGLAGAAAASIIEFHRVALNNAALSMLQACFQRLLYQDNMWLINIGHKHHLSWIRQCLILFPVVNFVEW